MLTSAEIPLESQNTVLVAEDDLSNLLVIETILKGQGYRIVTATDGKIAQDQLIKYSGQLSAILLDWLMPEISGIDLLRWIKTQPTLESVPVIMVTGLVTKQHVKEGIDAGVFYYLTKPFEQQILLSLVRSAVTDFQYRRALLQRLNKSENLLTSLVEGSFRFKTFEEGERLVLWVANACPFPRKAMLLSEIFINAVEHGNLGITYDEKTRLLMNNTWSQEIHRRLQLPENATKYVQVQIKKYTDKIDVSVEDQGPGFDYHKYLHFDESRVFDNHGRGIAVASAALDVEFLEKGNKVNVAIPLDRVS